MIGRGERHHLFGDDRAARFPVPVVVDIIRIAYPRLRYAAGRDERDVRLVFVDQPVAVVVQRIGGILALQKGAGNHRAVAFADQRIAEVGRGTVAVVVDAVLRVAGRFKKGEGGYPHRIRPKKFVAHPVKVRHKGDVLKEVEIGNVVAAIAPYAIRQPHGHARLAEIARTVVLRPVDEKDHVLDENLAPRQHPHLGKQTHAPAGEVGRVGEIRGIPVVLVVADLVEKFLVGVEHILAEKAVPRIAPPRVLYVGKFVRPGGRPGGRLVRLGDAVLAPRRIHVALDRLEGPRDVVVDGVAAEIGHIHDPQRIVVFVLHLGPHPQLGKRHIAPARVLGPLVPEIARASGLTRLRPVGNGGPDVVGVDVVAAALERIDALRARHMVPVDDALRAGRADKCFRQRRKTQDDQRAKHAQKRPSRKGTRRNSLSYEAEIFHGDCRPRRIRTAPRRQAALSSARGSVRGARTIPDRTVRCATDPALRPARPCRETRWPHCGRRGD